jgi:hypothetical protein
MDEINVYDYKNLIATNLHSRMIKETKYDVDERGIIEFDQWADICGEIEPIEMLSRVLIPKEVFVKAYNMFIKGESEESEIDKKKEC